MHRNGKRVGCEKGRGKNVREMGSIIKYREAGKAKDVVKKMGEGRR